MKLLTTLKTTTPLELLIALYCTAAITAIVWAVVFLSFYPANVLNN